MNGSTSILVIEDSRANLALLKHLLNQAGYQTCEAMDGDTGLAVAAQVLPDLILLDVMMPGIDGFECCRRLKANPQTAEIPVVFLTALSGLEHMSLAFGVGAVDYLIKPYTGPELLARVANHLKLRQAQNALLRQNRELNLALASRDKLFSLIAHDLKTPVNVQRSFIDHLLQLDPRENPEEVKELVQTLLKASEQTSRLLEGLLEWARTQILGVQAKPGPLDLNPLAQDLGLWLGRLSQEKKITLVFGLEGLPLAFADEQTVATVLRNLLVNAIKFSLSGTKVEVLGRDLGTELLVEVTDQGVGISEGAQKKLFQVGETVSTRGTSGETGTGLGLILCKEFVEQSGGRIGFESLQGRGSRFWFTLPKAQSHPD